MVSTEQLRADGWALVSTSVTPESLHELKEAIFLEGSAGKRCLLDQAAVRGIALDLKHELIASGILPPSSVAIQAIAFDKTPGMNWKVAWHQDLMFPFARAVTAAGYELPSRKGEVDFARPPLSVLEDLLAVRLHLDDCDETNGPLRVCPGTHTRGFIPSGDCSQLVTKEGEHTCLAKEGEALLMRPLLLHASSQAIHPKHRRVLHLVYHSGARIAEEWHRKV